MIGNPSQDGTGETPFGHMRAMQLYKLAWLIWVVGTALIVMSWVNIVSPTVGWTGFVIAMLGTLLSFVSNRLAGKS